MVEILQEREGHVSWASDGDEVRIELLYVHPEYRRQGHGTRLLKMAIAQIRKETIAPIELVALAMPGSTGVIQNDLPQWYEERGFETYMTEGGAHMLYIGDLENV